jgi:alkanesulfonate monooxygenase SsuD/methylene tetrahydromethanopterin reductase-like flavin-dependent oxidoreductase (luciferase family)
MFGAHMRPHDDRYKYATEWLDFVRRAWTEEAEFDFTSESFQRGLGLEPAEAAAEASSADHERGGSPAAQDFTTRYCDMNFVILKDRTFLEGAKAQIDHPQADGAARTGAKRGSGSRLCRVPGDREGGQGLSQLLRPREGRLGSGRQPPEDFRDCTTRPGRQDARTATRRTFIAGTGGYPLVGTAEQIVDELGKLADIGVDGCLISWVRYKEELAQWNAQVLPLMVQAGLRQPFPPAESARPGAPASRVSDAAVA